jgi:hypothetical protein
MGRRAQLLERVGDRHVVQLGGAEQTLEMIAMAEDGGSARGLVGTLAFEHPGAVMQDVGQ